MKFSAVLALTDFSSQAENALERAARIASRHGALLRLMCMREAESDWMVDRHTWLGQRASQLSRRHAIKVSALPDAASNLYDVLEETRRADLVVFSNFGNRRFPGSLGGRAIDQISRHSHCPVLIVRQPAARPYAHAVAALSSASLLNSVIGYARAFEDAAARMTVHTAVIPGKNRDPASGENARPGEVPVPKGRSAGRILHALREWFDRWGARAAANDSPRSIVRAILDQRDRWNADMIIVPKHRPTILSSLTMRDPVPRLIERLDCDLAFVPASELKQRVGPATQGQVARVDAAQGDQQRVWRS